MTTIYEIAKKAGVSITTVSRAINPETRQKVAAETLNRIDETIRRSRYTPNFLAKNLSRTRYKTIGIVVPHLPGLFFSNYYAKILSGIADALLETDYSFKLILLRYDRKWDEFNFKAGHGVDALVLTHWHLFFSEKEALNNLRIPFVAINDPEKDVRAHFVGGDNELGGELVAKYLHTKGHRNIGVLTGPSWSSDSRLRLSGFKSELRRRGTELNLEWILAADYQKEKAKVLVEQWLLGKPKVSAIFCFNDYMAFGVLEKLKQLRIACPGQVSVIGYDDELGAQYCHPPLTTVHVPLYELAKAAAQELVGFLDQKVKKTVLVGETKFPVTLVERQSVTDV
ncbi:MAG: LacI family DNA-binding transcriptional regulator [Candidatus Omnitrophota bacterium]